MPGSTPNSNILDAIDELIKAINDLGNRPISIQVLGGYGGCCGGGGSAPPLPPGTDPTEGSTPPEGYTPYTPSVDITACKKAAFVYFGTLTVLTELQKYEDTLQQGFDIALVVATAVLGRMGPVGALIVAKYSGVVDILTDMLDVSVDMQTLTQIWTEEQDALLCVLYNAASEGSGASYTGTMAEINGILSGAGASTGNLAVISSILTVETLTILWYNPTYRDVTIEQQIIDYTLPAGVDCAQCGCQLFDWTEGSEGWTVELTGNGNTVSGEWSTDVLGVSISKNTTPATSASVDWVLEPVGLTVSTDDTITAELNVITNNTCSGGNLAIIFDDNTSVVDFDLVDGIGSIIFSVTIPAEHDGKTISKIVLNVHDGDGCETGQVVAEWSYCEVCLAGS